MFTPNPPYSSSYLAGLGIICSYQLSTVVMESWNDDGLRGPGTQSHNTYKHLCSLLSIHPSEQMKSSYYSDSDTEWFLVPPSYFPNTFPPSPESSAVLGPSHSNLSRFHVSTTTPTLFQMTGPVPSRASCTLP